MDELRLIRRFLEMVAIPSESGEEEVFVDWLRDVLTKELGADCMLDDYGNLVARLSGKNSDRSEPVLFGVHADTVRPGKDIAPVLENGVIRSGGDTVLGADDKAGIAELLEALLSVDRHPPLEIVVTREEELGLVGAKELDVALLKARKGFLLDMDALNAVVVGGPSRMALDVEIIGRAAHAGMEPERGISAIRAAAQAIVSIREGWVGEGTTVNIGVIAGGENRNAVPERVTVNAECRSRDHERCLQESERVRRAFEETACALGARATVKLELAYRAIAIPEDSEVVGAATRAVESVGLTPKIEVICGGTDASVYNARGIQTVVMGTGVRCEHSSSEHILVEDMKKAVLMLQNLLLDLSESE